MATALSPSNANATAVLKEIATRYGYRVDVDHADATAAAAHSGSASGVYYVDTMDGSAHAGAAELAYGSPKYVPAYAGDAVASVGTAVLTHYGTGALTFSPAAATAASAARLTKQSVLYLAKQALGIGMAQDVYSAPSLVVGSDTLGWADLAADAVLETMTKAMPGGDGSLEWTLPGDAAWKYRNLLVPGAKVRLRVGGVAVWGGRLANDPLRERIEPGDEVPCEAGGLLSWAARCQVYGYACIDADEQQYFRTSREYDGSELVVLTGSGKFTVENEAYIRIAGEDDRSFAADSEARVSYWLHGGLDLGQRIVGIAYSYKCYLPTGWRFRVYSRTDPWSDDRYLEEYYNSSHTDWTASGTVTFTYPSTCTQFALVYTGSSASTAAPWVRVKNVRVYCRIDGASVDTEVPAGTAMGDVAGELADVVECEVLTEPLTSLMVRAEVPTTMADALGQLAALANDYVEYGFYLTDNGLDGFRAGIRPATVNPARNTHWDYGGRAGESADDLVRDAELAPDYVRLFYREDQSALVPEGTRRDVWYPSDPGSFDANVLAITEYADEPLTDVNALAYAARIWSDRQAAQWTGTINFTDVATTTLGIERPSWMIRPGDRVSIPGLLGASDLYISETTYDFASSTMAATIGHPWEFWSVAGAERFRHHPHREPRQALR